MDTRKKKRNIQGCRLSGFLSSNCILIITLLSALISLKGVDSSPVKATTSNNHGHTLDRSVEDEIHDAPTDHFAACILTMDDNYRMIEWLAYHYHTLPLRRLILMVDPRSKTSPEPVLDRWREHMKIDVWEDSDVFTKEQLVDRSDEGLVFLHRARQRTFNVKCMNTLRDEGAKWTLMTDVDEYLYINPRAWNSTDYLYQDKIAPIGIETPGSIMTMLNALDMDDSRVRMEGLFTCCSSTIWWNGEYLK